MLVRLSWIINEIRWCFVGIWHVLTGKYLRKDDSYANHKLYTDETGNALIKEAIISNKPFAYCRYSYTEMDIAVRTVTERLLKFPSTKAIKWLDIFCEPGESGFTGACKYTAVIEEAFGYADILGIWGNIWMGDALLKIQKVKDYLYVTDARSVEAYYYDSPWTEALEGKKVLVVSPFSKEIRKQYLVRDRIWPDKKVLPDFELDTEDSIWFYAGHRDSRFSNWFEAYEFLYESIMKHDFDIAILGCGYFGFPLATRIKRAGRQAIHMGGATQLLFGIKGKRWDNNANINRYYNEYWIRVDMAIKPKDDKNLDDGCYW